MASKKDRRTETLAMRVSASEHKRLRLMAVLSGGGEAALIRTAVNQWCEKEGQAPVFEIKEKAI